MNEIFEFVTLVFVSYLLLGCLITAVTATLLRYKSFNATTRHNIWLGTLVALVFMPLLTLLPRPAPNQIFQNESFRPFEQSITALRAVPAESVTTDLRTASQLQPSAFESSDPSFSPVVRELPGIDSAAKGFVSKLVVISSWLVSAISLSWIGGLLSVLIGTGIALKSILFIQSYRNLSKLFHSSVSVEGEIFVKARALAAQIGLRSCPAVKHSKQVSTPMASGVVQPWIVLPSSLIVGESSQPLLQQVLLHELAHIRRGDTAIATLQAIISIVLFWHPAVHYVNKHIRAERELASDDWVTNLTARDGTNQAKDYAASLVKIAESLQSPLAVGHAVACVRSSNSLKNRIKILLNRNIDHSTSVSRLPTMATNIGIALMLVVSIPVWPQLPVSQAMELTAGIIPTIPESDTPDELVSTPDDSSPDELIDNNLQELSPVLSNLETQINSEDDSSGFVANTSRPKIKSQALVVDSNPTLFEPSAVAVDINSIDELADEIGAQHTIAPDLELMPTETIQLALLTRDEIEDTSLAIAPETEASTAAAASSAGVDSPGEFFNVLARQQQRQTQAGPTIADLTGGFEVLGDITLRLVRHQIEVSERDFYELFNELNSSDEFDIICSLQALENSRYANQVCNPVFLDRYRKENEREVANSKARDRGAVGQFMSNLFGPRLLSDAALRARASDDYDRLNDEIGLLVETNADLQLGLLRINSLKTEIEDILEQELSELDALTAQNFRLGGGGYEDYLNSYGLEINPIDHLSVGYGSGVPGIEFNPAAAPSGGGSADAQ